MVYYAWVKNMKLKGVIFDMDGVLMDSERFSIRMFQELFAEMGLEFYLDYFISIMGTTPAYADQLTSERYGKENTPIIFEKYVRRMENGYQTHQIPLKPGAYELINYLLDNDFKMVLATSNHRDRAEMSFKQPPFNRMPFKYLVIGDMKIKSKPDPDIFLKAADLIGEDIRNCMVVEDSINGARAAINANSISVMVPDMVTPPEDVVRNICYIEKDLYEVLTLIKQLNCDEVL